MHVGGGCSGRLTHIPQNRIQDSLLHTLNAHPTNWPTAVQAHALALLRSGEISTFPALVRRVMDDIRAASASGGSAKPAVNGDVNGKKAAVNGEASAPPGGLAIPQTVVDEALRVTRESLESVVEIQEAGGATGAS